MQTQYLTVGTGKIAYDDQGSGPLVLCAPSLGDVRGEYRFLAPRLVAAGYRVVTMDVRGHGETSVGWADYRVTAIGSDMLALIKHLNAGPALIVGTSMSAGAAVCAAADGRDLVAGLVLIGPFARSMGPEWQARLMGATFGAVFSLPLVGRSLWKKYYTSLYPTARPADFDDYITKLIANLGERGRLGALRAMLRDTKAGSEARLDSVAVPVHILMGTRDPDFKKPADEVQILSKRLHATSQMIEGAGHYPHAEMPDQAAASILTFFESLRVGVGHGN